MLRQGAPASPKRSKNVHLRLVREDHEKFWRHRLRVAYNSVAGGAWVNHIRPCALETPLRQLVQQKRALVVGKGAQQKTSKAAA